MTLGRRQKEISINVITKIMQILQKNQAIYAKIYNKSNSKVVSRNRFLSFNVCKLQLLLQLVISFWKRAVEFSGDFVHDQSRQQQPR